uniref:ATP synthase complex subunit 8 n=1 Tax=Bradypus tridactylus TaxID=9354 RepID=A0A0S2LLK3_BRATR|nr:ATP synthase F0 subunit 8 [Bradypus tridactylus]ALO62223.1 ATP synthase F0 subunit 8 [Bradypus tridactylus]
MPQLDTSTWLVIILSTYISLFTLMQPKLAKHNFLTPSPTPKTSNTTTHPTPWKTKWTKICLPLLSPPQ